MAMLEVTELAFASDKAGRPRVHLLGREVILLAWDVPHAVHGVVPLSVADGVSIAPTASLRLARVDGGTRLLWALRRPGHAPLSIALSAGAPGVDAAIDLDVSQEVPAVDAAALVVGLEPAARIALVCALFNLWSSLFRLQRCRIFAAVLRGVLDALSPEPRPAGIVARASEDLVLLQTALASGFGRIDAIHILGDAGPMRLSARPHLAPAGRDGLRAVHLVADRAASFSRAPLVVFIGPDGLSVRAVAAPPRPLPSMVRWLREQAAAAPGLREQLLLDLAGRSEAGRAVALEAQLRAPLQPKRVTGGLAAPSAEITTALATRAGTLVTGWFRDPAELVSGIEAPAADGSVTDLTAALHRFPVDVEGPGEGVRLRATGFAALAPGFDAAVPLLQPRFRLRLKSGAFHALVPPPQPADPVEARAAALRAVPPQHVDEKLLADVIAPVVADLHARARARVGEPVVLRIGEPLARPLVSIVVPLYKVLDFLRFQIGAFAADPWLRTHAELIYVLDSPEQAKDVEHLLTGLHLVYALPVTLVVMARNGGFARACNTGAAEARGAALAMVNSDVVPTAPGWLEALLARFDGRQQVGAVGPKLLFADGSLQHAGMYFARDHRGRWLNHHFHKGMPRDYAPACVERLVPAVTGACLILPRALYEEVGGFNEDYVIGDYEDSDLCLKITERDLRILYVPDVELYHLERQSMAQSADYMRGIAWQYNCALHAARWNDLIAAIMHLGGPRRPADTLPAVEAEAPADIDPRHRRVVRSINA
ncbi:glycosyltransferase [Chelatococcus sp. SYSU_G07232]|uniref:Glycosyltransferase n=1 Tax=Chelatococcus albus TaxID=3047466 RepID=A0ABT7ALP0_9HYPH|nr:glycosyltransferase [Chelatococcus sp. SYSU_G07232]MDJ1159985.1 glycosyltransferase [Chelatococcus sp. SYSU_G07232]